MTGMSGPSVQDSGGKGGTFCQFTVGSGQVGASARYLRYIAHPQAVRGGGGRTCGSRRFPPF